MFSRLPSQTLIHGTYPTGSANHQPPLRQIFPGSKGSQPQSRVWRRQHRPSVVVLYRFPHRVQACIYLQPLCFFSRSAATLASLVSVVSSKRGQAVRPGPLITLKAPEKHHSLTAKWGILYALGTNECLIVPCIFQHQCRPWFGGGCLHLEPSERPSYPVQFSGAQCKTLGLIMALGGAGVGRRRLPWSTRRGLIFCLFREANVGTKQA